MSDEYTPDTDDVREEYAFAAASCGKPRGECDHHAEFDRWLAKFESKVRADQIEKDVAIAYDLSKKDGTYVFGGVWVPNAGMRDVARVIRAQLNGENDG